MLSCSVCLWSTALRNSSPFRDGALQLLKLQLAHQNAAADGNKKACQLIESEFLREVEVFRPCFTMSASLEVAQQYSKQLFRALHYFHLKEDPLTRQIDLILGKQGMRENQRRGSVHGQGLFKTHRRCNGTSGAQRGAPVDTLPLEDRLLMERQETILPTELPNPPRIDPNEKRRDGALRIRHRHRGHWVLQEPEIAITRSERREDPW